MAVGDYLPVIVSPANNSNELSLSKSSSPFGLRRRLAPVATHNSSAFIRFPISSRKTSSFVPIYQQRNRSTVRPCSLIKDTHSISDKSKSSNPTLSSIVSEKQKSNPSKKPSNPILSNPLLNHRKEQPKPIPNRFPTSFSHTSRICVSSKTVSKTNPKSKFRSNTAPLLANQKTETHSDEQVISNENEYEEQQDIELFDETKYNYITRWIQDIRQTKERVETLPKIKPPKKRFVQS